MVAKIFNHGMNADQYLSYSYLHLVIRIQEYKNTIWCLWTPKKITEILEMLKRALWVHSEELCLSAVNHVRCHENLECRQTSS